MVVTETKRLNVYEAIAQVTKKLSAHGIGKGQKNVQQGYKFRGIDDIYNALAPLIAEAGLCILPRVLNRSVTERTTKNGGILFYVVSEVEYDFVSAMDGSKHTVKVIGEAMDSGDKATNKAMSAAYKYACLQTFCIPTEGDNDADATTHQVAQAFKTKQAKTISWKALKDAAAEDDELKARETWDELNSDQQSEIWKELSSGQRSTIKLLLKQSKEES